MEYKNFHTVQLFALFLKIHLKSITYKRHQARCQLIAFIYLLFYCQFLSVFIIYFLPFSLADNIVEAFIFSFYCRNALLTFVK